MTNQIIFDIESRNAIQEGVDKVANAIKVTLGPKGRNVSFISRHRKVLATKDGATVGKNINLEEGTPEWMGAEVIKDVASKTADDCGDGSSTSAILAQAIVSEGLKNVASGANPMDLKRGIEAAVEKLVEKVKEMSLEVDTKDDRIKQIATISANNDSDIGGLIAEAMIKVGKEGVITYEPSNTTETHIELAEGMKFSRGYKSPHFATNTNKMVAEYENPYILLYDTKISNMNEVLPLMERIWGDKSKPERPLLIICDNVEGEALAALVVNKIKGGMPVVAIQAPEYGQIREEYLEDIATVTGGTVISMQKGLELEHTDIDRLGSAAKVVVSKDSTTIIGGFGKKETIEQRAASIRTQLENSKSEEDKKSLNGRLARLTGGVAILKVGAASEIEMNEKMYRVEDALLATRAAVEEGVVPGGGVAIIRAKQQISEESFKDHHDVNRDFLTGVGIVMKAIEEPLKQIANNGGSEGVTVVAEVKKLSGFEGYNARNEKYEDLLVAGVIDPTKVTRVSLENAASIASMILTTECVIYTKKTEK